MFNLSDVITHGHLKMLKDSALGRGGMLKIYDSDTKMWGMVCNNKWDDQDAFVACQQLGFEEGVRVRNHIVKSSPGISSFSLSDFSCLNNESKLINCDHKRCKTISCRRCLVAGLFCYNQHCKYVLDTIMHGSN